jgi:hypothetical protein
LSVAPSFTALAPGHTRWINTVAAGGDPSSIVTLPRMNESARPTWQIRQSVTVVDANVARRGMTSHCTAGW